MVTLDWEKVNDKISESGRMDHGLAISRAKVPGGWLVREVMPGMQGGCSLTFLPDPKHAWRGR